MDFRERLALGIDPGTAVMGYGLVGLVQDRVRLIDYGVLTTSPDQPLEKRLKTLYDGLMDLMQRRKPTEVAVEELFFSKNVRTALAVGHARGVAVLAAANCGLTVSEYTPLQIKLAVVGYGRARKEQIQQMVRVLLDLQVVPEPDDAADALALAICHLHSRHANSFIEACVSD